MNSDPKRLMDDPYFGLALREWASEEGAVEPLSPALRAEVAGLVAATVAGAIGVGALAASVSTTSTATAAGGVGASTASVGASVVATASVAPGAVVAGASLATGLSGLSSAVVGLSLVPKILAGVALAGALGTGGMVAVERAQERSALAKSGEETAPRRGQPWAPNAEELRAVLGEEPLKAQRAGEPDFESAAEVSPGARADAAEPLPRSALGSKRTGTSAAAKTPLADEVALLRRVRAVVDSDPEEAWRLLGEYHKRHPDGALRAEYQALVVRAQMAMPQE
jgi:hypothetical protein